VTKPGSRANKIFKPCVEGSYRISRRGSDDLFNGYVDLEGADEGVQRVGRIR